MKRFLRKIGKNIRHQNDEIHTFFSEYGDALNISNWRLLRPMMIVYLAYLLLYRVLVCPYLNEALQTTVLNYAIVIQLVFTILLFCLRKRQPNRKLVCFIILLFALELLSMAAFLDLFVFTDEISFLTPLVITLMTQIYTLPPVFVLSLINGSSVIYLVGCMIMKKSEVIIFDTISVIIALGIATLAYFSLLNYKLREHQTQTALKKMCALDPMTKVNNKETFRYLVEQYLNKGETDGRVAFAVCDLDGLKSINDTCGHMRGDEIILELSNTLKSLFQDDDSVIIGRFGGDEFVLFFKNVDSYDAVTKKVGCIFTDTKDAIPLTCSVGLVFAHAKRNSYDFLFETADCNLYKAKADSQGTVYITVEG